MRIRSSLGRLRSGIAETGELGVFFFYIEYKWFLLEESVGLILVIDLVFP